MISPIEALHLLTIGGCEHTTYRRHDNPGACFRDGRSVYAKYGADMACPACIARLALTSAGYDVDEESAVAEAGPLLPDFRMAYYARAAGGHWTPDRGWVAS